MGKPSVRIVLDKDTLPKLLPEGDLDAKLTLDNDVINLLNETASRLVKKYVFSHLEQDVREATRLKYGLSWSSSDTYKDIVKRAVESLATNLIHEQYKAIVVDLEKQVRDLAEERLKAMKGVITQMTTPENMKELLTNACMAIVKRKM